jgi:hypothetical protein
MADSIETYARVELQNMEQIVTAVHSLGDIAASLQPQDMESYAYLAGYLGAELQRQFQAFHVTISQQVLPLVADIKSMKAA